MFCKCLVHGRLATRSSALSLSYASALTMRLSLFLSLAPVLVSANNYTFSLRARQAIECPVLSEGVNPCGDGYIASYWTCCKDGSSGCAAPEVCEAKASGQYGCSTPSVTTPGGTNTDTGTCADTGQADCGASCMPAADTCCPDQSSYCPASEQCWLGADSACSCCPLGSTCDGPGSLGGGSTQTPSSATSRQNIDSLAVVIFAGLLRALRNLL